MPELLNINQTPCISLYMPTHRVHPDKLQDPLKFKELMKELEESLSQKHTAAETKALLTPYHKLAENFDFWQHTGEGLAVLSTLDKFYVLGLESPVKELVVVSDSFHTKPLRNYLQTLERYQVLGLSMNDVHFYEGNRHSLVEVALAEGVPATLTEALGDQLTQKYLSASSGGAAPGGARIQHGHGGKNDEVEKDTERFFIVVARAIEEHYSNPSGLPLILVALPEHHSVFQKVSNNPHLLTKGVMINPKSVSIEKLKQLAWEVIEPSYFAKLGKLAEQFNQAKANGNGSDTLEEIAKAAAAGRVDTLLLEADREIPGRLEKENGTIELQQRGNPEFDDLLDDIGELVTQKGGKVVIVPVEKMPTFTGIAAVLRY